jgi:uncharacterized protein
MRGCWVGWRRTLATGSEGYSKKEYGHFSSHSKCLSLVLVQTSQAPGVFKRHTKSGRTLAEEVLQERGGVLVTLDNLLQLYAARADPVGFVQALVKNNRCVGIDEVQRVPDLVLVVKEVIDRDRLPGRFLLTGSSDILNVRGVQDSLAGRTETVELEVFSQAELHGVAETFIDRVFDSTPLNFKRSALLRSDYLEFACVGGYPEVFARDPSRRRGWFRSYTKSLVNHDLSDTGVRRDDLFGPLLHACAAKTATELKVANLASDLQAPASTLPILLDKLESMYLIKRIPAWSSNLSERVIRRPKLVMADSALAAALSNLDARRAEVGRDPDLAGAMIETFVIGELRRQLGFTQGEFQMFHYRDREHREIDLVLESADGSVIAVEIKASSTPVSSDMKWVRWLSEKLGNRFVAGILLHTGQDSVAFSPKLYALPISTL